MAERTPRGQHWPTHGEVDSDPRKKPTYRDRGKRDAERGAPAVDLNGSEQRVVEYWRGWLDVYHTETEVRRVCALTGYSPASWVFES